MRKRVRSAMTAAALVSAGVGCGAAAAPVAGSVRASSASVAWGARYDGRANNWNYAASVFPHRAPRKSQFAISFRQGRCSDGAAYSGEDFPLKRQGFSISATGAGVFHGYYAHAFALDKHGRRAVGSERFTARLQFVGDTVVGVLTDVFTSRRLRCSSGPVSFAAWRDGTPQAPLNTSQGTTGRYRGRSAYGDRMSMQVFMPLRMVTKLTVTFRAGAPCSGAIHATGANTFTFRDIPINGSSFGLRGHYSYVYRGVRYRERYSITANPVRAPTWNFVVTGWIGGRRIGTCRTPRIGGDPFRLTPPHGRQV